MYMFVFAIWMICLYVLYEGTIYVHVCMCYMFVFAIWMICLYVLYE